MIRSKELRLDLAVHITTTALFCLFLFFFTRNLFYPLAFAFGGLLIDLDHLFDYFYYFRNKFSLKAFVNARHLKSGKIFLLLHSWEVVLFIFLASLVAGSYSFYLFALSLIIHLAIDNLQRKDKLFYFFTYRLLKKFDAFVLLRDEKEKFFWALRE